MMFLVRRWDFFLSLVASTAGVYFLPYNSVKNITTELMAFFSIQSAVILPAMIFTAGIIKPDGLELEDAKRYHKALRRQMQFWVSLLCLDFIAVFSLIAGKAIDWNLVVVTSDEFSPVDLSWFIPSVLYFSGALAVFRTIPFVKGVLSLLDLNSDMAMKAITRRNQNENAEKKAQADPREMILPEGYGRVVKSGDE